MNRKRLRKIIRNIVLIPILFLLTTRVLGLYLRPENLFRDSELGLNYGPSEIVYSEKDREGNLYLLSKFDKNFYVASLEKRWIFFYSIGSQSISENTGQDIEIGLYYNGDKEENLLVYGIKNEEKIESIELILDNKSYLVEDFHEKMFLERFKTDDYRGLEVLGRDKNGLIIFEKEY